MNNKEINEFFNSRYRKWLSYTRKIAYPAGMIGEAEDILHSVLLEILTDKPADFLFSLMSRKHENGTELDYYICRIIKINILSCRSAYRYRRERLRVDRDIDTDSLELVEELRNDAGNCTIDDVHNILSAMTEFTAEQKEIFLYKLTHGSFAGFNSTVYRSNKSLYTIYKKISSKIITKMRSLFY